ncbi:MAG: LytTR family DNA-binding domain-containing protein [Coriobacteriia bacterium]|nr:LytTR family DNA-binding domain-containing protein [Coriobacteriia bacterium]
MSDGISVLVVDDDPATIEMVRAGLEADGMRVLVAADGFEAIEVVEHESIDVITLEIMMSAVDGWMVLVQIRGNPASADIPVIVLTRKDDDLAKILAFKQGVQQYVAKPFSSLELAARVESLALNRRNLLKGRSGVAEGDFRKIAVRKGNRTILLSIDEVVFFSARNKSTYAHTYENQFLVDFTLGEIEDKLTGGPFTRVHRSHLINLNMIHEIRRADGAYVVVASDRDETHIPVARRQARAFRHAVGI